MPTYEYICRQCRREWEISFENSDKNRKSFCSECGSPGEQVHFTAPAVIGSERREATKFADSATRRELENGGFSRIKQRTWEEIAGASRPKEVNPFATREMPVNENFMSMAAGATASAKHDSEFASVRGMKPVDTRGFKDVPKHVPTQVIARYDGEDA